MAIHGMNHYGEMELSQDISHRWLDTVANVYDREWKLVEKYALHNFAGGGGGEYPLQDGFGWTNGVTRKLMVDHPAHRIHSVVCSVA